MGAVQWINISEQNNKNGDKRMEMRFRAHETFSIRKGWLSKGMENIVAKPNLFVDKNENPMDVLGIGSNMVKALRFWLQAVGLTKEPKSGKRKQTLTHLGELVYENDKYIEETGTLYILQYQLACQKKEATSWYFFFNEFTLSEFTRDDFVQELQKYILMSDENIKVAIRSLNDDFSCIVNTYLPSLKFNRDKVSPENNIDCPFSELGLLDIVNKKKKLYKKSVPSPDSIDPWIAYAVIMDRSENRKEINLNELLNKPCNIGKVFNLDAITMLEILHEIENIDLIKIIRTAGLDVIYINKPMDFYECVNQYYKNLDGDLWAGVGK